jgi:hypothetical protein
VNDSDGSVCTVDNPIPPGLAAAVIEFSANCAYRAECHVTAVGFWENIHLALGVSSAAAAGAAGALAFSDHGTIAGALAVAASVLSVTLATVGAGERAAEHQDCGNELNRLSEEGKRLVALPSNRNAGDISAAFEALIHNRDAVASRAPFVNRRLGRLARYFLDEGYGYYSRGDGRAEPGMMRRVSRRLIRGVW